MLASSRHRCRQLAQNKLTFRLSPGSPRNPSDVTYLFWYTDGNRPACGDRPGLREENREDPTARDRAGAEPGARGSMMEVEYGTGS